MKVECALVCSECMVHGVACPEAMGCGLEEVLVGSDRGMTMFVQGFLVPLTPAKVVRGADRCCCVAFYLCLCLCEERTRLEEELVVAVSQLCEAELPSKDLDSPEARACRCLFFPVYGFATRRGGRHHAVGWGVMVVP